MLKPNTLIGNRYRIMRSAAPSLDDSSARATAMLYEAFDQEQGTMVLLKHLPSRAVEAQRTMARETTRLRGREHPGLATLLDHGPVAEGYIVVFQGIPGATVAELLDQRGAPSSLAEVHAYGEQILNALHYLHQHGLLHGAIAPHTIKMSAESGTAILIDYRLGIAPHPADRLCRHYSAPELMEHEGDPRSDLFSVGATLYHMLTGRVPVDVSTRQAACSRGNPDPLQPPHRLDSQIPQPLSELLMQALNLDPNRRPVNAMAMRLTLQQALHDVEVTSPPPASPTRDRSVASFPPGLFVWSNKHRMVLASLIGVMLVGFLVLLIGPINEISFGWGSGRESDNDIAEQESPTAPRATKSPVPSPQPPEPVALLQPTTTTMPTIPITQPVATALPPMPSSTPIPTIPPVTPTPMPPTSVPSTPVPLPIDAPEQMTLAGFPVYPDAISAAADDPLIRALESGLRAHFTQDETDVAIYALPNAVSFEETRDFYSNELSGWRRSGETLRQESSLGLLEGATWIQGRQKLAMVYFTGGTDEPPLIFLVLATRP